MSSSNSRSKLEVCLGPKLAQSYIVKFKDHTSWDKKVDILPHPNFSHFRLPGDVSLNAATGLLDFILISIAELINIFHRNNGGT